MGAEFTVKPRAVVAAIGMALMKDNPKVGRAYLDKSDLRRAIEKSAAYGDEDKYKE